jgi:predicted HAD superfamily hydrolase
LEDKAQCYRKTLSKAKLYDFLTPAEEVIADDNKTDKLFLDSTALVTAPALTAYVLWILSDVVGNGVKTLFFLARDGLVLCNIAKSLCKTWKLDIDCRYLYVSRVALRLPLYVIDRDFALDKLCASTYKVNLQDILDRVHISDASSRLLARELGIDKDKPLSKAQLAKVKDALAVNASFHNHAMSNSEAALQAVDGYLRQEFAGVSDFALVDTGWMGSVQACLSYLLNHAIGIPRSSVAGYYLGMFHHGNPNFGRYECFLFKNAREMARRFRGFSNNVAECLCAADHGMTIGYEQKNGGWVPELADFEQGGCASAWDAHTQVEICAAYAEWFANINTNMIKSEGADELKVIAKRLLLGLMAKPSLAEAQLYGAIPFSDGMTADVSATLAAEMPPEQVRYKSFSYRVFDLLRGKRDANIPECPVYWVNGALAMSGCGALRRFDVRLLDRLYWVLYQ